MYTIIGFIKIEKIVAREFSDIHIFFFKLNYYREAVLFFSEQWYLLRFSFTKKMVIFYITLRYKLKKKHYFTFIIYYYTLIWILKN
jgi:hypothetical protein